MRPGNRSPTRSLWRGVLPGHRDQNTIRGNQALDSPHPPASVSPGFVSRALQQSAQGFLWFGRRALGHCTTAVQKSVTFLACHAHLAGIGSLYRAFYHVGRPRRTASQQRRSIAAPQIDAAALRRLIMKL
jgi:hypothetical protein